MPMIKMLCMYLFHARTCTCVLSVSMMCFIARSRSTKATSNLDFATHDQGLGLRGLEAQTIKCRIRAPDWRSENGKIEGSTRADYFVQEWTSPGQREATEFPRGFRLKVFLLHRTGLGYELFNRNKFIIYTYCLLYFPVAYSSEDS